MEGHSSLRIVNLLQISSNMTSDIMLSVQNELFPVLGNKSRVIRGRE